MQVFFEFPDFGFGPAANSVALIAATPELSDAVLVSTGGCLRFAQSQLPGHRSIDLDTFSSPVASAQALAEMAEPGDLVISNTNPFFTTAALDAGLAVGVVDALDWMWPALPDNYVDVDFRIVQAAFPGVEPRYQPHLNNPSLVDRVRPFIRTDLWRPADAPVRRGTALIALGGMALPFGPEVPGLYVDWLTRTVIPRIVDHAQCEVVELIGGHPELTSMVAGRVADNVQVLGGVDQARYYELLTSAEWRFVTPGTTTFYELSAARLSACFLPGYNLTHFLHVAQILDAGLDITAVRWPDEDALIAALPPMTHLEAENATLEHVRKHVATPSLWSGAIEIIDRYLDTPSLATTIPLIDEGLPSAEALLSRYVQRWTDRFDQRTA